MVSKLLVAIAIGFASLSCAAQVVPDVVRPPLSFTAGGGMNYSSGDWGNGDINRWGPSAWATLSVWRDLSVIAEGHSMIWGGNDLASQYKYFAGGGGLIYTSGYWGRFQPFVRGGADFASLSHPDNGTGHFHQSSYIWALGGGAEYHIKGNVWARAEYLYDFFPDFHSSISNENHSLNPHGINFGATYRFGPAGSKF
jgi:opacity protein-like surface antigen